MQLAAHHQVYALKLLLSMLFALILRKADVSAIFALMNVSVSPESEQIPGLGAFVNGLQV